MQQFDTYTAAREHLDSQGYTYECMDTWGVDGNIYLFNGPKAGERAGLFYRRRLNRWLISFWTR